MAMRLFDPRPLLLGNEALSGLHDLEQRLRSEAQMQALQARAEAARVERAFNDRQKAREAKAAGGHFLDFTGIG